MACVSVHPALRRFTEQVAEFHIHPKQIADILPLISQEYPQLAQAIMTDGVLSPYVVLYVNERPIESYAAEDNVCESSTIELITSLVGG